MSSRMSRSSSTTRISAIALPPCYVLSSGKVITAAAPECAPSCERVGIQKLQRPAVLFDNFLNDREPKPRARIARGHIGLEQFCAILRETDAIVGHRDGQSGRVLGRCQRHSNFWPHRPSGAPFSISGFRGFPGVLQQVCEGLAHQGRIDGRRDRTVSGISICQVMPGWPDCCRVTASTGQLRQILGLGFGLGHPREFGENSLTMRRRSPVWRT